MAQHTSTSQTLVSTTGLVGDGSEISGRIKLTADSGQSVAPGELVDTLVYFVPKAGGAHVHPGAYTVYTINRDFKPSAMAIPLGSTVTFKNLDQIRHNVFSVTPGSAFNLGFQASGVAVTQVFNRPGLVLISCNVHRSMELDLLVVPTPYMASVSADGTFTIRNVPAGSGTLYVWNPRAKLVADAVSAPALNVSEHVVAMKPHVPTELNAASAP